MTSSPDFTLTLARGRCCVFRSVCTGLPGPTSARMFGRARHCVRAAYYFPRAAFQICRSGPSAPYIGSLSGIGRAAIP